MGSILNEKRSFPAEEGSLQQCLDYIEQTLAAAGRSRRESMKALLLAEELLPLFIQHARPGSEIQIQVRRLLGNVSLSVRCGGEPFVLSEVQPVQELAALEETAAAEAIRSILLKSMEDDFTFSSKGGVNRVSIRVGRTQRSMLIFTVAAIVLGFLAGLLLRSVPGGMAEFISLNILDSAKGMFLNALKMIIGPVVFFSIVSSVSQYKDISELGRLGARIMGIYCCTSIAAVMIAVGADLIMHPGVPGFALMMSAEAPAAVADSDQDISLVSAIVNIVPSNLLQPFIESDTLQLIFLGVLVGIALNMSGEHSAPLCELFEGANRLFLTITRIVTKFMPIAVFCSIAGMTLYMDTKALTSMLSFVAAQFFAVIMMLLFYGVMILVLARLNPLTFYRNNREGMLASMALSSSSAALPVNLRTCTDKMGISPKIASFSIPLGATVNMDGGCIFMVLSCIFLARAYGIALPAQTLAAMGITVLLLSLGAPGVPGACFVCLGVILTDIGVPIEAMGIIMGIVPILDMLDTMLNTTGDVAATLIVAKREGLLDTDVYNGRDE